MGYQSKELGAGGWGRAGRRWVWCKESARGTSLWCWNIQYLDSGSEYMSLHR